MALSVLVLSSLMALSQVSASDAGDDVVDGTSKAVDGTVNVTKDVGRDAGKVIESTGKATTDVFQ